MAHSNTLYRTAARTNRFNATILSFSQHRSLTSTPTVGEELLQQSTAAPDIDPSLAGTAKEEQLLKERGLNPIGSRRRRAAIQSSPNIPFEQLPYQCFQEARKILAEDRVEKLRQIEREKRRIANLETRDASELGGQHIKKGRLMAMQKHLHELKIKADINDPLIKKRFEDGLGDMDRPIYRHLEEKKWRSYKRLILNQRLTQMFVVPDILPHIDITADTSISFGRKTVQPGDFVDSKVSATAPTLNVQVFDKGPRLVTVLVVDPDVPNVEKDGFDSRCHFLASNIEITPTKTQIALGDLPAANIVHDWLPPHSQMGSPYHRLAVLVFQQPEGKTLDVNAIKERYQRWEFSARSFTAKHHVTPVSGSLFRTIWDDNTANVMRASGIEGADIQFKPKKQEALPWHRKVKNGERYR